jgi:uncharacterized coiled-coil protein SlyX
LSSIDQQLKDALALSQKAIANVSKTAKLEERLLLVEEESTRSRSTVASLKLEIKTLKESHKSQVKDLTERLEREKEGRAADSEPLLDRIHELEEKVKENNKTIKDNSDRLTHVSISLSP